MARPIKKGLDYFCLDAQFWMDTKIQNLLVKEGPIGVLVYIVALALIYQQGYYLETDLTDLAARISAMFMFYKDVEKNKVLQCLETMLHFNLFDNISYEYEKVITSHGIQSFFYSATIRRKPGDKPHWMLSEAEMENLTRYAKSKHIITDNMSTQNELLQTENELLPTENGLLQPNLLNKKVKVKVKDKEDKDDKYDKRNCPFHLDYFTSCLINDHLIDVYNIDIHRFVQLFKELQEENDFELLTRCFRYTRDYCRKHKDEIYDLYDFFSYALKENIRKMDGYDERMEKYYAELDAYLSSIRRDN